MRERIQRNVDIDPVSGCWIWNAQQDGRGYGQLSDRIMGKLRKLKAHRVAYIAFKRWPPARRPEVAHSIKCVAPLCVNPAHLRSTTRSENELDKGRKERWRLREIAVLDAPRHFRVG